MIKHINDFAGIVGVIGWTLAYILLIYRGVKDKTYGMPLVPLALNFGWEFVYSFYYPVNLVFNMIWFLLDIGIIYTYFKYGYASFNKFYPMKKQQWYCVSIFAFLTGFLINFFGHQFFSQYQNVLTKELIYVPALLGYIWSTVINVCMITMFFQRQSLNGQSFIISSSILFATFGYAIQLFTSVSHKLAYPFIILIILIGIIIQTYYTSLLYKQLKKEGKNPWTWV